MRDAQHLQQMTTRLTLACLFALLTLSVGCLPGERANDPLPDVTSDAAKTDAKTDIKGDGAAGDTAKDGAGDTAATDDVVGTGDVATDDVAQLGCLVDGDCGALVTLPCHATPTCNTTSGLCESAILPADTACASDLCFPGQKCDDAGACIGGTAKDCGDGNVCTLDLCGSGVCSHSFASALCDDGNVCTISDHCDKGACVTVSLDCDDFNPCTTDTCNDKGDPSGGVMNLCKNQGFSYNPAAAIACTGNAKDELAFCSGGTCGVAKDCDDKNPCTADSPNSLTGECEHTPQSNVACGTDKCNPGTCQIDDQGVAACVTKPKCTTTKVCQAVTCDANNGACGTPAPQAAGTACGDECTADGKCDGGVKPKCVGSPLVCNDGNPCTDETCIVGLGCNATPNSKTCTDGNGCTVSDVCTNGVCTGIAVTTDDGNPCTIDACDALAGVTHLTAPNGTDCGNSSTCSQGICKAK